MLPTVFFSISKYCFPLSLKIISKTLVKQQEQKDSRLEKNSLDKYTFSKLSKISKLESRGEIEVNNSHKKDKHNSLEIIVGKNVLNIAYYIFLMPALKNSKYGFGFKLQLE